MNLEGFRNRLKEKARGKAGMILIHNGVVRDSSRDGSKCTAVEVQVDRNRLGEIISETEEMPGIVAVDVEISEGRLEVGEDLMLLGVAGDFRENVISALTYCLERIKKEVTKKREFA